MRLADPARGFDQDQPLESRLRELSFLHETGQLLTATLDLDDVLGSLIAQVRDYFQVEAVSVALVDEASEQLTFRVAVGGGSEDVTGLSMPLGDGIAGWVARHGEPVVIADAYDDPRFYADIDKQTGFETHMLLAVPIQTDHRTIGVIEVMNPLSGSFEARAPELLAQVANRAAAAIRNAELYERARQAERRYESLFHTSPAPTIVMDFDTRILDLNQRACQMLGRSRDELIGSSWETLLEDQRHAFEAILQDVREKQQVQAEMKVPTPGGPRVLEAHMTTIDHGGRQLIQWIGHDVTEQAELERIRDDLMHMIVHDLRNPLGNVISSLQMMRAALIENDDELPLDEVVDVAMRSSEKLRRLIDSLLDLRRLEAGKADLDRSIVKPRALTREAVELVRPIISKKALELVVDIPETLPPALVDRDMAIRILTNILDNAAKFTPTGGKITLSLTLAEGDQELLFKVSDTGPGIAPEFQERIFERFTRLQNAKGTKGTGLGLPFCKLAVEAHGGRIWVESVAGAGSQFMFTLPSAEQ